MSWLGIDGEGIGRMPHRYVLLCASSSDGRFQEELEDVRGISTESALSWFLKLPGAGKHATDTRIAGYYLSYDWTMILRDLPNVALYRLLRPELRSISRDEGGGFTPIRWRGFTLDYLSGMIRIRRGERRVTIWDVGKFYQSRFVAALESSGIAPPALIERMKNERGTWKEDDLDRMKTYCFEECRHLAMLVEQLEAQHTALGLSPRTWHGPGSTASALLTKHKVVLSHARAPKLVEEAACRAYFGGRFEHSVIGRRESVFSYDIRSAYPHAILTLPCLAHGKWVHRRQAPRENAVALVRYRVTDIGDRAWGPLPCRLDSGSIVWSRGGHTGWAWNPEYQAAARGWKGVVYGREHWELVSRCSCEPFRFMQDLYDWRVSRPENKQVVKLAMNSGYGKLAQSIGGGSKWSSRVWAGIITATTRARLLDFISMHDDESRLFALATDGAYSAEKLDIEGASLGDWERDDKGLMTFVRPGIYWSHRDLLAWYGNPNDKTLTEAATKAVRSRGISRRHLLNQAMCAELAIDARESRALLGETQQFGGARECVYRTPSRQYRRSRLYGEWYNAPATLSLAPEPKRDSDWRPPLLDCVESAPYVKGGKDATLLKVIGSMLEGRIR